jgi:hypothetical protein
VISFKTWSQAQKHFAWPNIQAFSSSFKQHPNRRIFHMRKAMLFLAVFGLAGSLSAADPSVGTWKCNVAKSKFAPSTQAAVKEETLVKRELDPDQFELTVTGTRTDGSAISIKATHPQKGGVVKSQTLSAAWIAVVTVINPGDFYETLLQDGKQVQVTHAVISKDGKTMRNTIKGTDAKSKPYEGLVVWDKQ